MRYFQSGLMEVTCLVSPVRVRYAFHRARSTDNNNPVTSYAHLTRRPRRQGESQFDHRNAYNYDRCSSSTAFLLQLLFLSYTSCTIAAVGWLFCGFVQ